MASDTRKLQVGVFVLGAAAIATSAAIWLGANRFFADEVIMVTYFAESVQGLDPGSDIKYRGVPAGRVYAIEIAPDEKLIEVVMHVKTSVATLIRNDDTLRARLELAGITGLRYVEIDHQSGDGLRKSPALEFSPAYEVVSSTPSSFSAIQEGLGAIYDNVMAVDFEGISNDIRTTLNAADQFLRDDRMQRLLSSLADLSESAARVTRNVEKITEGVEVAPAIEELQRITAEARGFLQELRQQDLGEQIRGTLSDFGGVARSTKNFLSGLQDSIQKLDQSLENFESLTDDLSSHPSQLLFSKPPPPRRPHDRSGR